MSQFPYIDHIEKVEWAVEDHPNFVTIKGDCGHTYVDYVVQGDETFPAIPQLGPDDAVPHRAQVLRECRGIAFHTKSHKIRSRPFHKFFNLNERPETLFSTLAWDAPYTVQVKMDGSMIRPIRVHDDGGYWRLATRKGVTDVACEAELFTTYRGVGHYTALYEHAAHCNFTPIFEFVGPKNRHVLQYDRPQLVLLAVRKWMTGEYANEWTVKQLGTSFGIPVVEQYQMGDPAETIAALKAMEGMEGIVITFPDGTKVKVKCDWYAQLHRVKASLTRERDVLGMVLHQTIDDALQLLTPEMRETLNRFQNEAIRVIGQYGADLRRERREMIERYDRKAFALSAEAQAMDPLRKGLMFSVWDDETDLDTNIRRMLEKHIMSNSMYRRVKADVLAGLPDWQEFETGDEE